MPVYRPDQPTAASNKAGSRISRYRPDSTPQALKPYTFHGVNLGWKEGDEQACGDCPFCGKEGKFYVSIKDGQWDCKVCGITGNTYSFLNKLWETSGDSTTVPTHEELRMDRGLLLDSTLETWGVVQSSITGDWLVPGYNAEGKLNQLYVYLPDPKTGRRHLVPTPGLSASEMRHGLHGMPLFDRNRKIVYICEGCWDGMALWETFKLSKRSVNVLAVPGCNVFYDNWADLFAGMEVYLLYDNDHPRKVKTPSGRERMNPPGGYVGMKRTSAILLSHKKPPKSVNYIHWGNEGYNEELPHGFDVRDLLTKSDGNGKVTSLSERKRLVEELANLLVPVPSEWKKSSRSSRDDGQIGHLEPIPCMTWKDLTTSWRKALEWRQEIADILSVIMAVALSTDQVGDQLYLQVIGEPGTGKSRLCEGMLVSKHCFAIEHLTGFHSGWKDKTGKDYSLLARINHKTLITPEGDVLMSNPKFGEIMSQQRRIFDGSSSSSFKNKGETEYKGLRTPWIIAGTPALLNTDQSRLGDRFLRVFLHPPTDEEKRSILQRVGYNALRSVRLTSNGEEISTVDESLGIAYQMTGGYVDYLRGNAATLLGAVKANEAQLVRQCADLAEFVANLRSRPDVNWHKKDREKESEATKELPTRLTHQFVRLSVCLAVVLNRLSVDEEVMRLVRKVALDTARGKTMKMVNHLYSEGDSGCSVAGMAVIMTSTDERERSTFRFLKYLNVVESFRKVTANGKLSSTRVLWRLTRSFKELYERVMVEI